MQLTLQITSGPHAGRKVLLRSGQIARIGRTEWADFSFPRDADLADVHFAVQCQLHGARLRKLALDRQLAVNNQDVSEAELQPGDTILAGQSAFVVAFDGNVSGTLRDGGASGVLAAAAVAAGTASAIAANEQREPTALEIAQQLQMADEHVAIAKTVKTGPQFVSALAEKGAFAKAVRVQAHLLPKQEAVWWGILSVNAACGNNLPPEDAAAKDAALSWVEDPTDANRRRCESAAGKTKFDGPGSWLAMAAFWSSGSIAPEEMGEVLPDEKLTGQAIASSLMIAAVSGDATQAKPRYRGFLAQAPDVASGKIPLPPSKSTAS
jgi:hypothetical protein